MQMRTAVNLLIKRGARYINSLSALICKFRLWRKAHMQQSLHIKSNNQISENFVIATQRPKLTGHVNSDLNGNKDTFTVHVLVAKSNSDDKQVRPILWPEKLINLNETRTGQARITFEWYQSTWIPNVQRITINHESTFMLMTLCNFPKLVLVIPSSLCWTNLIGEPSCCK
jgi:hypothetical protein